MTKITSTQNKLIKEIVSLQTKSKDRKHNKLIVIEGQKEIELAISAGLKMEKVFYCSEIINFAEVEKIFQKQIYGLDIYEVSEVVFSKISYRETTGGIIAVAKMPEKNINELKINEQSVFIILESVEKPGNLGAICRVADAAKVDGVIICDPHTDIYNPNSIRSSLGCVFTVNIVNSSFDETTNWLKTNQIKTFATELNAANFYQNQNLKDKVAFVFGTEATGLTKKWIDFADIGIKIPMRGVIDSLNVTTSVAILVFEAMRQRGF
ncbi:RNA methyltransferase [Bacteroidales bacterium OttesenSCG-928-I21]|nr:RNA methyltransferase [Bacteroidales bacterium OttesenSCG-928-I21]